MLRIDGAGSVSLRRTIRDVYPEGELMLNGLPSTDLMMLTVVGGPYDGAIR